MVYATPAEEERMLAYTPKQAMPSSSAPTPPPQSPPSGLSTAESPVGITATTRRATSYALQTWRECRPWTEFYSTRALSRPEFAELSDRFAMNLHEYRANYQVVAAFWLLLVLLGSLQNLLLALLGFWGIEWWLSRKGEDVQHKHKVIAAMLVLVVVWLTRIGGSVVQSLVLSAVSVSLHAIFHEPQSVETEIATV